MNEYVDNEARKAKLVGKTVTMAHGAGGHQTSELIDRRENYRVKASPTKIRGLLLFWLYKSILICFISQVRIPYLSSQSPYQIP